MEILFPILLVLIFVVAIATLGLEGLWGNAIALVNVVTAALVATNFWEPIAGWLLAKEERGEYLWDFVTIWGLFIVVVSLMRLASDSLSRYRVRFPKLLDVIGGYFFAAWVGWMMICFTTFTLHTAPLAKNFMSGGFKPEERMLFHLAPDRQWLGFMQKMSLGSLRPRRRSERSRGPRVRSAGRFYDQVCLAAQAVREEHWPAAEEGRAVTGLPRLRNSRAPAVHFAV